MKTNNSRCLFSSAFFYFLDASPALPRLFQVHSFLPSVLTETHAVPRGHTWRKAGGWFGLLGRLGCRPFWPRPPVCLATHIPEGNYVSSFSGSKPNHPHFLDLTVPSCAKSWHSWWYFIFLASTRVSIAWLTDKLLLTAILRVLLVLSHHVIIPENMSEIGSR